jgi:hypothetical protein
LIVEEMARSGGGFAKALAEAFRRADAVNHGRLKRAFPEVWDHYADAARIRLHKGEVDDGVESGGSSEGEGGTSGDGVDPPSGG